MGLGLGSGLGVRVSSTACQLEASGATGEGDAGEEVAWAPPPLWVAPPPLWCVTRPRSADRGGGVGRRGKSRDAAPALLCASHASKLRPSSRPSWKRVGVRVGVGVRVRVRVGVRVRVRARVIRGPGASLEECGQATLLSVPPCLWRAWLGLGLGVGLGDG